MHGIRRIMLALVLTGAAGLGALAQEDGAASLDELRQQWTEAYDAADFEALANLYAEDAHLFPNDGQVYEGRDAIRQAIQGEWEAIHGALDGGDPRIELEALEAHDEGPLRYEAGTFTVLGPDDSAIDEGHYVVVTRMVEDALRIVAHMNTSMTQQPSLDVDGD